jgi:cytochrome c oxidase subunit 3
MASEMKLVEEANSTRAMHPMRFAMWLFIATIVMLFAALTSAYIVKRGAPGWSEIVLPQLFTVNTVVILLSSISMVWAVRAAKNNNVEMTKLALWITTILGLGFVVGQYLAYQEMITMNEYLTGGAVSHSFIYILSGAHVFHLIGGVFFLIIVLKSTYKRKVNANNLDQIEICATYWHFLDVLWLYLFVFLLLNK